MARYSKTAKVSDETRQEAMKIAKGTQRPGQTKEQTRLIAQGIQKGIDQYKRQQKIKARELDRKLKKLKSEIPDPEVEIRERVVARQHWLPWLLLLASWAVFGLYLLAI